MKSKVLMFTLCFLFLMAIPIFAQTIPTELPVLFKPFTSLRVIRTEYFDIIFPKESETSARDLASYADNVYEQLSSLFGIELHGRIPVSFTPHTDEFNGFFSPYNFIFLYDTPSNIEWTTFANNLEGLFIHELTHAVTLNTRSPFFKFMHRVFGMWASPALFNTPGFMLEGVAVSVESFEGFGRANDPRIRQHLRQAVYEDKFLTPLQASQLYDRPMQPSGYWYDYGGLFSMWLQTNYGMEKYAELWQKMGRASSFSFFVYRSGFYRMFRDVYGFEFLDAWHNFRDSFAVYLENNDDNLLPQKKRYFTDKQNFITGLTARGDNLYFIDRTERRTGIYNVTTNDLRTINTGSSIYDFDVSADGETLLLSGYNYTDERGIAVVTEISSANGINTGRSFRGFYRARYFRDGVVGIRSDLHNTNIIYETFDGESIVLFRGANNLMFSGPQPIDNESFVFVMSRNGRRELMLYNFVTEELYKIDLENPGEIDYWNYMRNLRVSDGKLFFSHNADDVMYKPAYIDLETMQAVFSNRNFSGGVYDPVSINDTIYYRGAFVERDRLLRFPETASEMTGERESIQFIRLNKENFEIFNENEEIFENTYMVNSFNENQFFENPYSETASRPYFGLRYTNPLQFWFPLPLIRIQDFDDNFKIKFDGGGFFTLMMDPAHRNAFLFLGYGDFRYNMLAVDQFIWMNTYMGFPLTLEFKDEISESSNPINTHRLTEVSLLGSFDYNTRLIRQVISAGAGYTRRANFQGGKNTAYEWKETRHGINVQASYFISYNNKLSFQFSTISYVDRFEPRVDGVFRANTDTRFPLSFNLFGAYDKQGMNLHGRSANYGNRLITNFALSEYNLPPGLNLNWLAGGEASINLFSFHIQRNLSHLYFNRISGSLALRNQFYDSMNNINAQGYKINDYRLIQSLMLRLSMRISVLPFVKQVVSFDPYISGAWKFTNTIMGHGSLWKINIGVNTSF